MLGAMLMQQLLNGIVVGSVYGLFALGFTLLYTTVPNCRVPVKAGIISGIVAAAPWRRAPSVLPRAACPSASALLRDWTSTRLRSLACASWRPPCPARSMLWAA